MPGVERTRGRPARGDAPGETPPGSDLGPRKTVRLQKYAYEKAKNDANSSNGVILAPGPISIRAISIHAMRAAACVGTGDGSKKASYLVAVAAANQVVLSRATTAHPLPRPRRSVR